MITNQIRADRVRTTFRVGGPPLAVRADWERRAQPTSQPAVFDPASVVDLPAPAWVARALVLGLPVTGYDRLVGGDGQMRWRVLGRLPVVRADGADVTRSAQGRLAAELPTVARAGWWYGSRRWDEGEFFRFRIGSARYC